MTIEQAISNLKRAKCVPYKKETLEMAIKALIEVDLVKMQYIDKINSIYGMYAQNLVKEGKTDGTL